MGLSPLHVGLSFGNFDLEDILGSATPAFCRGGIQANKTVAFVPARDGQPHPTSR